MMSHVLGDKCLENCFVASQFVNWLVLNDVTHDRHAAVVLGQQFLDILVIKPGLFLLISFVLFICLFCTLFKLFYRIKLYPNTKCTKLEIFEVKK